jgi:hypothetical protein
MPPPQSKIQHSKSNIQNQKFPSPLPPFAFRVCAPTRVGALRLYPVLLSGLGVSNSFPNQKFSIKNQTSARKRA